MREGPAYLYENRGTRTRDVVKTDPGPSLLWPQNRALRPYTQRTSPRTQGAVSTDPVGRLDEQPDHDRSQDPQL